MDRAEIVAEMGRVEADFAELIARAGRADLRRPSRGTRWTNRQLLYHMVFGYLIVRTLMRTSSPLSSPPASLNAARQPFHWINYVGSWVGGQVLPPATMAALMRRTIRALQRQLDRETEQTSALTMHFPTAWDPYFRPLMSVQDVYHYGTEHYDHHRRQLTLD